MVDKNLAQLSAIKIDTGKFKKSWDDIKFNNPDIRWQTRTYITENILDEYTKSIVHEIFEKTKLDAKNMLIQVAGELIEDNEKNMLNIVHRDVDRKTCITIPLIYNLAEAIMFHADIDDYGMGFRSNTSWPEKPIQISRYSSEHPTLVNVNRLHSVRLMDFKSPRVLLQLSFDESFQDIIDRNPDIWKVM
jgi:hypothetical protein